MPYADGKDRHVARDRRQGVAKKPVPVIAVKAATAPTVDGDASDAVWKTAPATKLTAIKGVNFKDGQGSTAATVQVAYSADTLYMLLSYDDPTLSVRRSPYVKQADGTWES